MAYLMKPRQYGIHFEDVIFKCKLLQDAMAYWVNLHYNMSPINNIPEIIQIMAWRQRGDMPLFEPMVVYSSDAYIYIYIIYI